jgi:hypothetical protein
VAQTDALPAGTKITKPSGKTKIGLGEQIPVDEPKTNQVNPMKNEHTTGWIVENSSGLQRKIPDMDSQKVSQ